MANKNTAIYGLVGYPLSHSFSKKYFTEKFQREDIDAEYLNFEIPDIDFLMEMISEYPALKGFNVTIPYKQQVMQYLDMIDREAQEIGAINVVKIIPKINGDFKLKGYNSDIIGFRNSITPLLTPNDKYALILGTGGASKAIDVALQKLGFETLKVSRNPHGQNEITYSDIDEKLLGKFTVIVNTTPVGMYPNIDSCPDIPYNLLNKNHLCYDLVYNPEKTKFLRLSAERGARVKNGMEMLVLQAEAAWEIWNSDI